MKSLWNHMSVMWQPAGAAIIGLALLISLFVVRLDNLVPGIHASEYEAANTSLSLQVIADNPANAPYKLARFGVMKVTENIVFQRALSGMVSVLVVVLFYQIVRYLWGRYIGILSTLLFATSTMLLSNGRLATPNIMLLSLFVLIMCGYALRFNTQRSLMWILTAIAIGLSLYVPGMVYFILIGIIWQFRTLQRPFGSARPGLLMLCFLIIALCFAPIVYAIVRDPSTWHGFLGLPETLPDLLTMFKTAASVPIGIFAVAPENPLYRLGSQPVLDIFTGCMFVLGSYALVKKHTLDRTKLLAGIFIIATAWCAVAGNFENVIVLLPFIYIVVAAGMQWMITEWFKVFPRNPLARSGAMVLIAIAVAFSCYFQAKRYFIAWPNNKTTIAIFSEGDRQ